MWHRLLHWVQWQKNTFFDHYFHFTFLNKPRDRIQKNVWQFMAWITPNFMGQDSRKMGSLEPPIFQMVNCLLSFPAAYTKFDVFFETKLNTRVKKNNISIWYNTCCAVFSIKSFGRCHHPESHRWKLSEQRRLAADRRDAARVEFVCLCLRAMDEGVFVALSNFVVSLSCVSAFSAKTCLSLSKGKKKKKEEEAGKKYHARRELISQAANSRGRWSSSKMKERNESSDLIFAPRRSRAREIVLTFGRFTLSL